jgi:PST family polysaccharide transporter
VGAVILVFSWVMVRKKLIPVRIEIDWDFWKTTLKKSIPFALMLVFTGLYMNLDTVLLSRIKGDEVVGLYNAANRLVLAAKMIPAVILPALFPIMAGMSRGTRAEFNRFLEKSSVLLLSLALPLSVGTTALAVKIIGFVYGSEFSASVICLQILIWGMFCMYVSIVFGYGLISQGKQKINTYLTGAGLVVSLILNLWLIPRLGNIGSSIAILSTEALVMVGGVVFARKLFGFNLKPLLPSCSKVVLSTVVMTAGLYLTRELHLLVCVAVGAASYFIMLFSLGGLYHYDFHRVKNLILARTA